jgi:hypothetical protein
MAGVQPRLRSVAASPMAAADTAAVEQAVEHNAPVDVDSLMRIPLISLRLGPAAVPVAGTQHGNPTLWGRHGIS